MEIIPYVFDAFMKPFEKRALNKRRQKLMKKVSGQVLEVGAGTGVNFGYYDSDKLESLSVVDLKFNKIIKKHSFNEIISVNYIEGDVQRLPFDDHTFDAVVATLIFCSVDNVRLALEEIYRVLKPGGKIYFIEHVLPEKVGYRNIVNTLNSTWKRIGKCNVNRETLNNIKEANFKIIDIERFGKAFFIFIAGVGIKE
ncbi:class I SAM-dependent methyltransferase [Crassaminicella profunda]|uniref:class I SAM-dependent methyltransferase n=1 Tax=Crassaminicella profunda TaxID=1286698 RepID=UPI001CA70C8D|nr:class I SAM-dependent methyltransferase [Crassaminicella profunda]QZY53720.1 class I SAM-dependent methyltransferase [Crassaminicella profunda]